MLLNAYHSKFTVVIGATMLFSSVGVNLAAEEGFYGEDKRLNSLIKFSPRAQIFLSRKKNAAPLWREAQRVNHGYTSHLIGS